jgi:3-oxoacyl-[acyl-carrier-protein] synthase-3
MGLATDWFTKRTGIEERRVCGEGEDALTLAVSAVQSALRASGLQSDGLGPETVLLHVQNGMTAFTPPAGVLLADALGISNLRVLSVDGVCAEPVAMFEMALLMLSGHRCSRAIISSSVDFLPIISPEDKDTVGLFGAGAGAAVIEHAASNGTSATIRSIQWVTHPHHADLGRIPVLGYSTSSAGVSVHVGFYDMKGGSLVHTGLRVLPPLVSRVLEEAGWHRHEVDLVISHQPNPRMLNIAIDALGFRREIFPMPVTRLGNMGPASLLVNLSLAADADKLRPGRRILLLAFGLGFSCGAAALELTSG